METPCDLWEGRTNKQTGYGVINLYVEKPPKYSKDFLAHRIVWMQDNGHTDLHIRHKCDVRNCINIDHLEPGTQADNMRDMAERDRRKREFCANGLHRLDETGVVWIGGRRRCKPCRQEYDRQRYLNREAS